MIYDPAIAAQRLAEAQAALHSLRLGQSVVVVKVDGREVHYKASTIEALQAYVDELSRCVTGPTAYRRGRAIGVIFN